MVFNFQFYRTRLFENLRMLPHAPGVQIQPIPEDAIDVDMEEDEDKQNSEERISIRASEKRICNENELSDSEDEGDNRKDSRSHKKTKKTKSDVASNDSKSVSDKKEGDNSNGVEKTTPSESVATSIMVENNSSDDKK